MRKNKNIGARVIVGSVTVDCIAKKGWVRTKKVFGTIVKMEPMYEQYYYTAAGDFSHPTKHIIKDDIFERYAIQLDDGLTDIAGNNIIICRYFDIKFIEYLPPKHKVVTLNQYNRALRIIEKYEAQLKETSSIQQNS